MRLNESRLGFGAGGFWGMGVFDESVARSLVDIALEQGITLFDTGPNYSGGNAEVRLGRVLGSRAKDVFIGTKGGTHLRNGKHVKDYSRTGLTASFEESLRRLGREHVDLYQLHDMPDVLADDTRQFLVDLKSSGRAARLGVSTDVSGARRAIDLGIFEVVMIEYNVINRIKPEAVIETAAKQGIGVLVKSPLAQTLYSSEIFKVKSLADLWYLARAVKNHRHKIIEGQKYRFIDGHHTALQYVLANKDVTAAIIGTTSPGHLLANSHAARSDISPEMLSRIRAA